MSKKIKKDDIKTYYELRNELENIGRQYLIQLLEKAIEEAFELGLSFQHGTTPTEIKK